MNGYELTDKMRDEIKENPNHRLSLHSALVYIRFYGLNDLLRAQGSIRFVGQAAVDELHRALSSDELEIDEVKHGKWIINSDGYYPYCSCCKEEPKCGIMTKYCQNCGAIMDLEE